MKKLSVSLLALLALIFCFSETKSQQDLNQDYFEMNKAIEIFGSVFKNLHSNYVDDLNSGDLVKTAIDAMLAKLDPYTVYYPESDMENVKMQLLGQYGGIGSLIHKQNNHIMISEPYENLPAHKAGLKAGDIILKIDGESCEGKTTSQVSERLRGQAGTTIELTLERDEKQFTKTLKREEIKLPNVSYSGMIDENVGYIKLTEFTKDAGLHVLQAYKKLEAQGAKYLVLDLRDNGGGLLNEAVNIVNLFVEKGNVVVSKKTKHIEKNATYKTTQKVAAPNVPIVVLINPYSASASEIVAGSLQDLDRAVVIGQRSFGKGLVQTIIPLVYNSQMKVTESKYYIPSGRCIQAIDYSHRNENGFAEKIPDSLKTAYKTKNGRTVYAGSGIEPDILLEPYTPSNIAISLAGNFHCFNYANKFVKEHQSILPASEFEITDDIYEDFIHFLKDKDYHYVTSSEKTIDALIENAQKEQIDSVTLSQINDLKQRIIEDKKNDIYKFKDEIKLLLLDEIITRYYYQKGSIEASLNHDKEVKRAIEILKNKEE
ncbi:MAG: S41 family peptidase, partial [Bacteroidales bacterium]|nr:S41 family peptidase [Bacteroidales bacterium]